jgi:peroxiredoxin
MVIAVGSSFPSCTLLEYNHKEGEGCPIGPTAVHTDAALKNKRVVLFSVPGAFTPTCSNNHLPGYLTHRQALSGAGVDEVWCVAVNDAFVMDAWGKAAGAEKGGVRMLADGSAAMARALGLELDLTAKGMGMRMRRTAMIIKDGIVTHLFVEEPGKFEVSSAEHVLKALL